MINSILTNTVALSIRNNLNSSNSKMSCTLERLSSGLKINRVKDDTANSIISSKLNLQLSGLDIVNKNAMQGINMLNVADSALENMTNKVSRIRDLAFQALNSTYSTDELAVIQNEIDLLIDEIRREKETTVYNEKKIFDPTTETVTEIKPPEKPYAYEVEYIQSDGKQWVDTGFTCDKNENYSYRMVGDFRGNSGSWSGANAYLQLNFNGNGVTNGTGAKGTLTGSDEIICSYKDVKESLVVNGQKISDRSWSTYSGNDVKIGIFKLGNNGDTWYNSTKTTKGKLEAFQLYKDDVMVRDYIPVIDNNGKACLYDKITGEFAYNAGTGEFKTGNIIPPEESTFETSIYDNSTTLQIGAKDGVDNTVTFDLGFNLDGLNINVMSINSSKVAIQQCDELIDVFSLRRSKVGSVQNRIESIISLQDNDKINLSATNSTIKDADIALESANLAKVQILEQISTSLFSQAHQITGGLAMKLLGVVWRKWLYICKIKTN